MRGRIRFAIRAILWLLVVIGIPGLIAEWSFRNDQKKESDSVAARKKEEDEKNTAIINFASSYGAVRNWRQALSQFAFNAPIYSFQLEPVLLSRQGQKILFIVQLVNISERNGKPILYLESRVNMHSELRLELVAESEIATRITQTKINEEEDSLAVVAQIDSVAGQPADDSWKADNRRPISVAKGRCVDVLYLGRYTGDFDEILSTFKEPER